MSYGTVQVGRLILREDRDTSLKVNAQSGGVTLALTGQQSFPGSYTSVQVEQAMADIASSTTAVIPVVFTEKVALNGYYSVAESADNQSKNDADGEYLAPEAMSVDDQITDHEI